MRRYDPEGVFASFAAPLRMISRSTKACIPGLVYSLKLVLANGNGSNVSYEVMGSDRKRAISKPVIS